MKALINSISIVLFLIFSFYGYSATGTALIDIFDKEFLYGDLAPFGEGDGLLSASDFTLSLECLRSTMPFGGEEFELVDVAPLGICDGSCVPIQVVPIPDGRIDTSDLTAILQKISGYVEFVPHCSCEIAGIEPSSAEIGEVVAIGGFGFGQIQGASTIAFNGIDAGTAEEWAGLLIKVRVPEGATTGSVVITVEGKPPSNPFDFVVLPSLKRIIPDAGAVDDLITIEGSLFGEEQGESKVYFNGVDSGVANHWSENSITVSVPLGASSGPVYIDLGDGVLSRSVPFERLALEGIISINEVIFYPNEGEFEQVELINKGRGTIDISGYELTDEDDNVYTIPDGFPTVPSGGLVLIVFGSTGTKRDLKTDGKTFILHTEDALINVFEDETDQISLYNSSVHSTETIVDFVAWGGDAEDDDDLAVEAGMWINADFVVIGGSLGEIPIVQGGSIGKYANNAQLHRFEWKIYPPDQRSPGSVNPLLIPYLRHPCSEEVHRNPVSFIWNTIEGAQSYRLQIDDTADFSSPVVDVNIDESCFETQLDDGVFYARIKSRSFEGIEGPFSDFCEFSVYVPIARHYGKRAGEVKLEAFPHIQKHKETKMLCAAGCQLNGKKERWDEPHTKTREHSSGWCSIVSCEMLNHFYGGDIPADLIAYRERVQESISKTFQGRDPLSPINMAGHNEGTPLPVKGQSGQFNPFNTMAFNTLKWLLTINESDPLLVNEIKPYDERPSWEEIKSWIDEGRPIFLASFGGFSWYSSDHAVVITGYDDDLIYDDVLVHDPDSKKGFEAHNWNSYPPSNRYCHWIVPPPSVTAIRIADFASFPSLEIDQDGDGMIDFDETPPFGHRFETVDSLNQDPDKLTDINNPDTDGDNVNDKNEIKLYRRGGWDRNLDQDDFLPPWDDDSDNGGREDGEEDTDRDGEYDRWNPFDNELDPLDAQDDFVDNDPPNAPTNGQTEIVSSHEAVFTWDCSDPDSDLMRFKIIINQDEEPKDVTIYNDYFKSVFDSTMNFSFSKLDSEKTYWWSVRAQDPLGAVGPRSDWWSFTTPCGSTKIEVDSGQIVGSISSEAFHIYYFEVIADGGIYTITVSPTSGDPDLYASRYQGDVDEIEDLLRWDETCPPSSSHCASSTEMGLADETVTFKTICGEGYYSYFAVSSDEESQYKVQVIRTDCTDADGDCYSPDGGECGPEDCRDNDTMIHPGAIEGPEGDPTCSDGFDNDCDFHIDLEDEDCGFPLSTTTTTTTTTTTLPQVLEEWVTRYNGPGNGYDGATAIAVDGAGNVYVTGQSAGSGTYEDYATIKYNASGSQLWVARYNGPDNGGDKANAIAVDGAGNVYVTGQIDKSEVYTDYGTIKYNASGSQLWVARYDGPGNRYDEAFGLAVDSLGNVYVTGDSNGAYPSANDYATIKYNPSGSQLWVARYDGPAHSVEYANAIVVDDSGNVYVTGASYGGHTKNYDYATIKYNASGSQLWVARYDGPENDWDLAYALAVDSSGNVYVTGRSDGNDTNYGYATIKYNASGSQLWVARYDGPDYCNSHAKAIALDSSGNVYVTGWSCWSYGSDTADYATIKYDSSGSQLWVARYNGPDNAGDKANAIAVDGADNVYVTGCIDKIYLNKSESYADYGTIKYDSSGSQLWVARYDGPGNSYDEAKAIAVDSSGNVYVTGESTGSSGTDDYATVKYSYGHHTQSNLPDTGIELCYNDTQEVECPTSGEPFYGQDAQYSKNPMSFTDRGDGTVTDNVTGLTWQQEDDYVTRTWYEAIDYCERLVLADHTDWRLPDEYELQGIVDYGRYNPSIDTTYFPRTASFWYWSSSTCADDLDDAWVVYFYFGDAQKNYKHFHRYVRCVRGESHDQNFIDNENGTVTDTRTQLTWQQEDDSVTREWEDALSFCENLALAGHTDWRLPDIKELRSIVENTTYSPAINTSYFLDAASSWYWSSSTCAYFCTRAWDIDFYDGGSGIGYGSIKSANGHVRCVR